MAGGVSMYVQDNRLCLDYNAREDLTVGRADVQLPTGKTTLTAKLTSGEGGSGVVTLSVDAEAVGSVHIPSLRGIAVRGGADVGGDQYSPVTSSYEAPFEFSGTIHVVDIKITPRGALPRPPTPQEASEAS